ncbi:MAG: lytic transglycosylase domain-containing protein [Blastocatellales bacterium]
MRLSFVGKSPLMVIFICLLAGVVARADELHLKNGRVVEAEEVWEVADAVWYRQGKVISSFAKSDVARITKSKPPPPARLSSLAGGSAEDGDEEVTRTVTRIMLKGGRQIDADAVWENAKWLGYRLGKMQTVIDRRDVERIVHDVTVTEPKSVASNSSLRYTTGHSGLDRLIAHSGDKYDIDPTLIYLIMREESRFNHRAVSRVGARGLMQLMPGTAAKLGVRNIHDPVENVDAGTRYLRTLLEMFNGDVNLALAAYNAGEGAVIRYGRRIPPYRETMNYVWRINTAYRRAMAANRNE